MKLKRVVFDDQGFRNLCNLTIDIAPRITVIAGHNGIGKSTILGLISNGTEYKNHKRLLGKKFRSDFSEIFYLDYTDDFYSRSEGASTADLIYAVGDVEITKVCTVTAGHKDLINKKLYKPFMAKVDKSTLTLKQEEGLQNKLEQEPSESFLYVYRVRIIPRTKDSKLLPSDLLEKYNVSDAAKIELPTIYLGMSRISPIGEFDKTTISHREAKKDFETIEYINNFFNNVIPYRRKDVSSLYAHTFSKSNKQSLVPEFTHSSLAISLGQDSLSSIATAFASFKSLKDKIGADYRGGILVIDEIEAGFHPKAQLKLMNVIQTEARKLKLQVIVTSHSLTILKSVFDKASEKNPEPLDRIVYLMDTQMPKAMKNPTYSKIKKDMLLEVNPNSNVGVLPKIKIYFEDNEAKYFFEKILDFKGITKKSYQFGRDFETISLEIGCEILVKLVKTDGYFKSTVLIADNDVASKQTNRAVIDKHDNFCILPGSKNITSNSPAHHRNPEMLIYHFIESRLDDPKKYPDFWGNSGMFTTDYVRENIVKQSPSQQQDRVAMKTWFKESLYYFNELKIISLWCEENLSLVDDFIKDLGSAVDAAAKNIDMANSQTI